MSDPSRAIHNNQDSNGRETMTMNDGNNNSINNSNDNNSSLDPSQPKGDERRQQQPQAPVLSEIRLPSAEHKLFCWKVRQGAAVRQGETIALAMLKTTSTNTSATAGSEAAAPTAPQAPASSSQYKRPTKRKRPNASNTSVTSSTAKAPPTATTAPKNSSRENPTPHPFIKLPAPISKPTPAADETSKSDEASAMTDHANTTASSSSTTSSSLSPTTTTTTTKSSIDRIPLLAGSNGIIRFGRPKGSEDPLVIGVILQCEHPTVVSGMCVVCGQPTDSNNNNLYSGNSNNNDNENQSSFNQSDSTSSPEGGGEKLRRVTVSGGVTVIISDSEGQRMAQEDSVRLRKQSKLSLVLDLDHTLLHATNDVRARRHLSRSDVRSLILPVQLEGSAGDAHNNMRPPQQVWMQHFVKLRPHLKEFLEMASTMYEVRVYTAGTRQYAEQITLLLARHLVGSRLDQIDMDHLRHQISHAQQALEKQKHEQKSESEAGADKDNEKLDDDNKKGDDGNKDGMEEQTTCKSGHKRKRVTFGESTEKTDAVKPEDLTRLKSDLEKAERMEQRALECRQRLFGTRIVSRTDVPELGLDVKSLTRIFPCGGSMAVVVDDREDVWANAAENEIKGEPPINMLLVRPYHWGPFAGFADVNNASGEDFGTGGKSDEKDEDDQQLLWTADILRRIHEAYYEHVDSSTSDPPLTVPQIVRELKANVLKNTKLVLSGLVPTNRPPLPRSQFVRHAENLGAKLLSKVTPEVTHVVAARDGTDKVLAARRISGCHIVKHSWLMECVWTLTRRDVRPHLMPPGKKQSASSSSSSSKSIGRTDSYEENSVAEDSAKTAMSLEEESNDLVERKSESNPNEQVDSTTTPETKDEEEDQKEKVEKEDDTARQVEDDDNDDDDDDDDLVAELESELKEDD